MTAGFGELRSVALNNFKGLVVPEASSRHGVDTYYTVDADHFNVCRPESKVNASYTVLANLVDKVIKKDEALVPFTNDVPDIVVGLEEALEAIRLRLVAESRVAIVGMGGIGKTTLAQAVFQRIGKHFQYSCFYEEVKNSMGKKESSKSLRDKIGQRFVDGRGRSVGKAFRWNDLRGKRVLMVLDDVISENQIKVMMGNDEFHEESRVIVTARNRGFIDKAKLGFHIHEVEKLGQDNSTELFCRCAFGKKQSPAEFSKHVDDIVNKCDGLPLALTITGKYLYSERKSMWEEAFTKLREAKPFDGENEDDLWSVLRTSVDSLAYEEKEMFLDVAACFHGERLDQVQMLWRVCKWAFPLMGWRNLLDRHLVRQKKEGLYTTVYMHEILRDLGRSIAGRSRMLMSDPHFVDTSLNEEALDVKVVKGDIEESDHSREDLLCKLTKMKVLWLAIHRNVEKSNHSPRMESNWSALKEVLFTKLSGAKISTLEKICVFQNLQGLDISECYELEAIPAAIGRLQRLQNLDVSYCSEVEEIPAEIGGLQRLQDLNMRFCTKLIAIPAEIGGLHTLQNLNISQCSELDTIPRGIGGLQSLVS